MMISLYCYIDIFILFILFILTAITAHLVFFCLILSPILLVTLKLITVLKENRVELDILLCLTAYFPFSSAVLHFLRYKKARRFFALTCYLNFYK